MIIVKSAKRFIHYIYRESFWPAYVQLGMLGTILTMMPVVKVTATITEQTKSYIVSFLAIVDPEIIAVNLIRQNIFYTCLT